MSALYDKISREDILAHAYARSAQDVFARALFLCRRPIDTYVLKLLRSLEEPALAVCLFLGGRGLVGELVQLIGSHCIRLICPRARSLLWPRPHRQPDLDQAADGF